jgi:hypothetical protein
MIGAEILPRQMGCNVEGMNSLSNRIEYQMQDRPRSGRVKIVVKECGG